MVRAPQLGRPRRRARGGARGDRDVRGHARRARARPDRRGRVPRPGAGAAGHRHRRDASRALAPRRGGRAPRHVLRAATTSSSPRPARSTTTRSSRWSIASSAGARRRRCRRASSVTGASAPGRAVPGARHRAVPRLPRRRPASRAARRAPVRGQRCSTRCSAAARRRGCSRRSASGAAWPTRSTPSARTTATRVTSASTSAPATRTSRSASSVIGREIGAVAAGNFDPDELERAKDEHEGPPGAVAGVHVRPHGPARPRDPARPAAARRGPRSRRASTPSRSTTSRCWPASCSRRRASRPPCIGTDEAVFSTGLDALLGRRRV